MKKKRWTKIKTAEKEKITSEKRRKNAKKKGKRQKRLKRENRGENKTLS
jgi:hypothetical protein